MSRIYLLLASTVLILLCACAGIEPSVMDTANVLGVGRYSASSTFTMGLNLPEWQRIDPEDIFDGDTILPATYLEAQAGVSADADIAVRLAAHDEIQSGKVLFKKQIAKKAKSSSAVVMALGAAKAKARYFDADEWDTDETERYEIYTGEMHLLNTRNLGKAYYLTFAARASLHQLLTKDMSGNWEKELIYHTGARASIRKYFLNQFYIVWELGVEYPASIPGVRQVYPWTGFRQGVEF